VVSNLLPFNYPTALRVIKASENVSLSSRYLKKCHKTSFCDLWHSPLITLLEIPRKNEPLGESSEGEVVKGKVVKV